ncbi:MAG: nucleoside hydrolase [Cyclobacteriaceae bacterium]|jgi:hypothetical protein
MLAGLFLIDSCQLKEKTDHPKALKVILDTDMGSDCDDAGAMALLHKYADLGKVEILGCIYSSGKVPYGAGVIEAINIYYGRPQIPVGANWGNEVGDPVDKMGTEKLSKNTALFKNKIIHNRDAEEQTSLNRRLLAQQKDNSVDYITIGHTKGLYDLLVSEPDDISPLTGFELVRNKIRRWVALGALGANNKEGNHTKDWNFFFNGTAKYTKYLVETFPKPIYFINSGTDILTGKSLIFTPENNIVRIAYEDWLWNYEKKGLEDQRPSWDIVTVYFAVEGSGNYLEEEETGLLSFDIVKGCRWEKEESNLQHHYIFQKEGISDQFANYINEMISADPLLGDNSH